MPLVTHVSSPALSLSLSSSSLSFSLGLLIMQCTLHSHERRIYALSDGPAWDSVSFQLADGVRSVYLNKLIPDRIVLNSNMSRDPN